MFFGMAPNIAIYTPPPGFVPNPEAAKLPQLAGGGATPLLTYAMSTNPALQAAVKALVQASPSLSPDDFRAAVETILFKWTGAETRAAHHQASADRKLAA